LRCVKGIATAGSPSWAAEARAHIVSTKLRARPKHLRDFILSGWLVTQ
jgi:hypothetical protein